MQANQKHPALKPPVRVLIVAGSDSGGGAGIQADIKTVTALGGYASTAITALTAQNTLGVHKILLVDPDFLGAQMQVVLEDLGSDVVKTGMLPTRKAIETVARVLAQSARDVPLVVDPVMTAKGGFSLADSSACDTLEQILFPRADLITPNLDEAAGLTRLNVEDVDGMRKAAYRLIEKGARAVLIKGGHLPTDTLTDLLVWDRGEELFSSRRIATRHTHGTGCTLASAIATLLAGGKPLVEAVSHAREYLHKAIRTAPGLGQGHGPLNHAHPWG